MSRNSSREHAVTIAGSADVIELIREDRTSASSVNMNSVPESDKKIESDEKVIICPCKGFLEAERALRNQEEIERLLDEREKEMDTKVQDQIQSEMEYLKGRFEFILQNEQIRSSYMLREAHRERQEKISALQTQLECKNLAGMMYVMCSERRRSKLEIMRLTEEYTNYIQALQKILAESQALILHLSRGYRTVAKVDFEWRQKMMKMIKHFQNFVNSFIGGCPETNQYLFDVPDLLMIDAPIEENPEESPCENEEISNKDGIKPSEPWWKSNAGEDRPFIMFGDMSDFKPPQRREILKCVKAGKTAPKKWKEYVFNDMPLKSNCRNSELMKHEHLKQISTGRWECTQTEQPTFSRGVLVLCVCTGEGQQHKITRTAFTNPPAQCGDDGQKNTLLGRSVSSSGLQLAEETLGALLTYTATSRRVPQTPKTTLLGARDSMEIASTTKLREKQRHTVDHGKVVLNIGNKIDSMFSQMYPEIEANHEEVEGPVIRSSNKIKDEENEDESLSALGSVHKDSLLIIPSHVPDHDHKINSEKICPMEKCQRLQVDSFIRSLPAYMRASPFTHFEQTYEEYEPCSPEQLEILKHRIEEKKKKEKVDFNLTEADPLLSWTPSLEGIAVQTSDTSILPPCTCRVPSPTQVSSTQNVLNIADLFPIKQKLNKINATCFFDDNINFNRFKVIGHDVSVANINYKKVEDFANQTLQGIKKTLKQHPSLYEIF